MRDLDIRPSLELVFGSGLDPRSRIEGKGAMVQRYLDVRKPRDELVKLKAATTALGKALADHFSVDEILLEIDRGLHRRDR